MPGGQHQHRAGGLRQTNKRNKRRTASKRSRAVRAGGKIHKTAAGAHANANASSSSSPAQQLAARSKANRRNHQQQLRDGQRQARLRQRRGLAAPTGSSSSSSSLPPPPPRLVGVIGLSPNAAAVEGRVRAHLVRRADRVLVSNHGKKNGEAAAVNNETSAADGRTAAVTCQYAAHKRDGALTVLTTAAVAAAIGSNNNNGNGGDGDDSAAVAAALDLARVCDVLLFVVDGDAPPPDDTAAAAGVLGMEIAGAAADSSSSVKTTNTATKNSSSSSPLDHLISERGDRILSAVKAQGLPTPLTLLVRRTTSTSGDDDENNGADDDGINDTIADDHATLPTTTFTAASAKSARRSRLKRHLELQRYVRRFAATEFGSGRDKVLEVDLSNVNDDGDDDDDDEKNSNRATTAAAVTITAPPSNSSSSSSSSDALVRTLCTVACRPAKWVSQSPRPYLVADGTMYDASAQTLRIRGYLRGLCPWDARSLVHVPGVGTAACRSIARATPPLQQQERERRRKNRSAAAPPPMAMEEEEMGDENNVVLADPTQREPLDMFAAPDALEGEQNLIGFDDDADDGDGDNKDEPAAERPAGWSDYQSAWLDAVDQGDDDDEEGNHDTGELADELNGKGGSSLAGAGATTLGDGTMMDLDADDIDANQVSESERRALMLERRQKQQSEEADFPDEVQVRDDEKARDRFARYRSLKSFRKSYWDPKENLPDSFASIYHFASFKQTQRSVMNDMKELVREAEAVQGNFFGKTLDRPSSNVAKKAAAAAAAGEEEDAMEVQEQCDGDEEEDFLEGCVPTGSYVTLTLESVSPKAMSAIAPQALLTAVALLPHENKVSVLHMGLSQTAGCDATDGALAVKSKDVLTFRCGWRTWQARPVFSQNNLNCDKHKFERFLPTGGTFFAASVFGPVTYTPCPVLVFREASSDNPTCRRRQMVAVGSMLGADADRIVVKRVILTGYPVRVHKRHATVKYMFYDPEDVKWFKPAGLYTKHGLQGNIVQSVGEHGTMKCLFNAPIKQHDTVCMPLYKRIYPKYAPQRSSSGSSSSGTCKQEGSSTSLVVL